MRKRAIYSCINDIIGNDDAPNPTSGDQRRVIDLNSIAQFLKQGVSGSDGQTITLEAVIEEAIQYSSNSDENGPFFNAITVDVTRKLGQLEADLNELRNARASDNESDSGSEDQPLQQSEQLQQQIDALKLLLNNLAELNSRIKKAQTDYQFVDVSINSAPIHNQEQAALIANFLRMMIIQYGSRLNLENDVKDRLRAESRNARARISPIAFYALFPVSFFPWVLCEAVGLIHYSAVLVIPIVVCGLAVLFRTIRDTKHDFQLRPWATFAFIGLSALFFAGLGVWLLYMWYALAHAGFAGVTFTYIFSVSTTVTVAFSFMMTEFIKVLVNLIDSSVARKNDSYSGIHSGCQIDEAKLKATCDNNNWDIDVTREALKTLVAQYEKNENQNFPATQTSYGRKTLNLFSSILNGKYLNKDNEPIITTVVDDVVQKFDLRGSEDYQLRGMQV